MSDKLKGDPGTLSWKVNLEYLFCVYVLFSLAFPIQVFLGVLWIIFIPGHAFTYSIH